MDGSRERRIGREDGRAGFDHVILRVANPETGDISDQVSGARLHGLIQLTALRADCFVWFGHAYGVSGLRPLEPPAAIWRHQRGDAEGYILNVGQLRGRCKQALRLRGCGVIWGLCVMQRKRACMNVSIMYQLQCSQGGVQVPTGGMW